MKAVALLVLPSAVVTYLIVERLKSEWLILALMVLLITVAAFGQKARNANDKGGAILALIQIAVLNLANVYAFAETLRSHQSLAFQLAVVLPITLLLPLAIHFRVWSRIFPPPVKRSTTPETHTAETGRDGRSLSFGPGPEIPPRATSDILPPSRHRFKAVPTMGRDGELIAMTFTWTDNYIGSAEQNALSRATWRIDRVIVPYVFTTGGLALLALFSGSLGLVWSLIGLLFGGALLLLLGMSLTSQLRLRSADRVLLFSRNALFSDGVPVGSGQQVWGDDLEQLGAFEYGPLSQWSGDPAENAVTRVWVTTSAGYPITISTNTWGRDFSHMLVHQLMDAKTRLAGSPRSQARHQPNPFTD